MIPLTRLNGSQMYVNADLVATVEAPHDTVVTLVDGKTYVVRDSVAEVVESVVRYRALVLATASRLQPEEQEPDAPGRLFVLHPATPTGE